MLNHRMVDSISKIGAVAVRYFNENYLVDEYGRLFSLFSGEIKELKPYLNKGGYYVYRLRLNGVTKHLSAHHLSYWVNVSRFDSNDGLVIDHIDGNKRNNYYKNLRRVSIKQNARNINTCQPVGKYTKNAYRVSPEEFLPAGYDPLKPFDPSGVRAKKCVGLCALCGRNTTGKLCLKCYQEEKAKNIPSKEELLEELFSGKSLVNLGKMHGISDNAYRKWLAKRGLPTKKKDIENLIRTHSQAV